jgi:hypothetical protein
MAYGFSVFWKPLQGALLGADGKAVPECSAQSARRPRQERHGYAKDKTRGPSMSGLTRWTGNRVARNEDADR